MRKYLAAAVVAVMVFAFAAFAASLNVTAPVLQVGETAEGELECADTVEITAWMYDDVSGTIDGARLSVINADGSEQDGDPGDDCFEERLMLTALDDQGSILFTVGGNQARGSVEIHEDNFHSDVGFTVAFGLSDPGPLNHYATAAGGFDVDDKVDASLVEGARVAITGN